MKDQGYGDGYAYDHDAEDGFSGQNYFPEEMQRCAYFIIQKEKASRGKL